MLKQKCKSAEDYGSIHSTSHFNLFNPVKNMSLLGGSPLNS